MVENTGFSPGVYMFEHESEWGLWGKYNKLVQMSQWVCKESDHGVVWIKNKLTGSKIPATLTQDELKQFMWIKLKAQDIA
jgi:hypothetical protein